jgi:hypothetical protein
MFLLYNVVTNVINMVMNRVGGVMVISSVVYQDFEPGWVKPKTIKLVFVAPPSGGSIKDIEQSLVGSEPG